MNTVSPSAVGLRSKPKAGGAAVVPVCGTLLDVRRCASHGAGAPGRASGGRGIRCGPPRASLKACLPPGLRAGRLGAGERLEQLARIQTELGITTLFVTHDQEEALAVADRVAVMRAGRIEQIGTPETLYTQPETTFVAEFIGETTKKVVRKAGPKKDA